MSKIVATLPKKIMTRFEGKYINNDALQKALLQDAVKFTELGKSDLVEYILGLVKELEKLKTLDI